MREIARVTGKTTAEIFGVATFYAQFRFTPIGKHVMKVCHGTACHVQGADSLDTVVEQKLGVKPGNTTADGEFTVERVACLGCCSLAPVVMIDGEVYGRLTGDKLGKIVAATGAHEQKAAAKA
jgi:NADH-quinone oxidoreductase subunit E